MWVMLAMFWAVEHDNPISLKVYQDRSFYSYQECQDSLLHNKNEIREVLSNMQISNRYSVKCIDASKHKILMDVLGIKSI